MATDTIGASLYGLGSDTQLATGTFTSDGNATSVTLGFEPRYVEVVNLTDNIIWEKHLGFPSNTTMKSVTGAQTVDTGSAITFGTDAGLNEPAAAMLLSSTLCSTAKSISWIAWS